MELATEQLPPPFPLFLQKPPRTGSLPSAPPSHVPPAASLATAVAAGGLTGVGGGADMVGDRGVRFGRSGHVSPIFIGIEIPWTTCSHPPAVRGASAATVLMPISLLSVSHSFSLSTWNSDQDQKFAHISCWDQTPMQVWPPNDTPYHPHGLGRVASWACSACLS